MITIDLPPDLEPQIDHAAQEFGRNKEDWIKAILLDYLEDMNDLREAEEIMENHNPTEDVSLEEMMARYSVENMFKASAAGKSTANANTDLINNPQSQP